MYVQLFPCGEWPQKVRDRLVLDRNPTGDITNSNLDVAVEVLSWLVLEPCVPLTHEHICICSNNMPTFSWAT